MATRYDDVVTFNGGFKTPGGYLTKVARTELVENSAIAYPVPWSAHRVWNALATNLPGTAAADDLSLQGNTFGTGSPSIQTSDLKNAGATSQYTRFQYEMPAEYVAAGTVTLRIHAGMNTTVASASATVDVECYRSDTEAGIGSDLCATAATTINSLTFADKDFTITASSLSPGDVLDVRVTVAVNDSATGTAVIGELGYLAFLLDIQG